MDKRNEKFKNLVIASLLISFVIMLVGVVVLAKNYIGIKPARWNVKIVNITEGTPTGGAKNKVPPYHTGYTMWFDVEFSAPGESMTYDVTVKNSGNIDAKVDDIDVVDYNTNKYIKYTMTGIKEGTIIRAGDSLTFKVKVEYIMTNELIYRDDPIYIELEFEQLA